jgi:8-oxo-dGTP diphosphatase/2-hydroxy-dATP diphosphatase
MKIILQTLCIVHQHPKVLLGMKKRGFGEGRWNGFGGKVKEDESIEGAMKREMSEECSIDVEGVELVGILDFQFQKDMSETLKVHIFRANDFTGEPTESEEMKPQWFNIDEIPFGKMWSDDPFWFPLFLQGKKFKGRFLFGENDTVLEKELEEVAELFI